MGNTCEETWTNICAGKTGIAPVDAFDEPERFGSTVGCQVRDFDGKAWFASPKTANANDRYTHLAMAAARQAYDDAKLNIGENADPDRVGVMIGSAFGGIGTVGVGIRADAEAGAATGLAFCDPRVVGQHGVRRRRHRAQLPGPNFGVVSACASGTHAIGEAMLAIQRGDADIIICGGSEAAMTPLMYGGFGAMKAMCTQFNETPEKQEALRCRPRGFCDGRGGRRHCFRVRGPREKRGASVYAELAGYGATCDAHHITARTRRCGAGAVFGRDSQTCRCGAVGGRLCQCHGTSTAYNDKFETMALKTVFGDHAYNLRVSSTKGATGHTMGAAGGIEAVLTCLAVKNDVCRP